MTFYQELQLNQAGSKSYIASFKNPKDKIKHTGIYLFKILLTVSFCTVFIALFCALFGNSNSIAFCVCGGIPELVVQQPLGDFRLCHGQGGRRWDGPGKTGI